MLNKKYFKKYQEKLEIDLRQSFNKLKGSGSLDFTYLIEASAVYSSNIEGNSMDLNSFMNTKILKAKAKPREFKEIMELVDAYNFANKNKLTEANLLQVHKILVKSFLIKSKRGKYRKEKVGVFSSQGLVYLAVEHELVDQEMKALFKIISKLLKQKLSIKEIFYFAAMMHLQFAHIHPFADGNGRAARLLEKWFLAKKLDKQAWLIQSEKYYKENISSYYKDINLGVNYYELDYNKCLPFLLMLPKALK